MIKILTGIIALGLVVFIHELGHFIAARLSGVVVETFSIGWGPVLFRKKVKNTEYRISALPLGGYCGMKGERAFSEALEKKLDEIPKEEGGFYSIHPLKRVCIAFAGPFFNLAFAIFALAIASAIGYTYESYENRIIPAIHDGAQQTPAVAAGIIEGDRITKLGDTEIVTFSDIQQYVATRPGETFPVEIDRNGERILTTITAELDKKTGAGRIGIYPYIPLVIGKVKQGSAAEAAGLKIGDVITSVDGNIVDHFLQFSKLLESKPEQISLTYTRDGIAHLCTLVLMYTKEGIESGISWKTIPVTVRGTGFFDSIMKGLTGTWKTIGLTIKSIGLLFRGVDVTEAVSGPVRITMMIGEVAQNSVSGLAELLSIICVSLFLMNLLPVPILDGGLILFALIEFAIRKPLKPKTMYYIQFIGIAFILGLFLLALFGDIKYLIK